VIWLDLFARFFVLAGLGFLLLVGIAILTQPGDEYSCAPDDSDEQDVWDDDDLREAS
jgi:hypothetical protein